MLRFAQKTFFILFLLFPLLLSGCSKPNLNILNFFKSKIDASAGVQCDYYDEKGNSATAYFKEDWFKIDGGITYNNLPGVIISKDNKLWIWNKEAAEGYVFDLSLDYSQYSVSKKKIVIKPEEITEKLEFQKQNCSPGLIEDSVFDIPGEVSFTAYEEYLQTK